MATFRYRKNGGQLLGSSVDTGIYRDDAYFGVLTDPPMPDGTDFAAPKLWDGTDLRNATRAEIDLFPVKVAEDNNLIARDDAVTALRGQSSKILRALVIEMKGVSTPTAIDAEMDILVSHIESGRADGP